MDKTKRKEKEDLQGFGGWLIFFVIVQTCWVIYYLVIGVVSLLNAQGGIYDIVAAIIGLVVVGFIAFSSSKWVPRVTIALLGLTVLSMVVSTPPEDMALGVLIGTIAWIVYFFRSKRVKNTYVN